MSHALFEKHQKTLTQACEAIQQRSYFSPYPEIPSGKVYGETAKADGIAAFEQRLNNRFELDMPSKGWTTKTETSPYGIELGISYPTVDLETLLPAMSQAQKAWSAASIETRIGVTLEILERLNKQSFQIANAIMHTTGQAFMMAFQAGGPHALDRGLEAVAHAYQEMTKTPSEVLWKKQVGKDQFAELTKRFRILPRGIAALVGCSTFPTWNGYPGLFASLATGNAVAVKPHRGAILPLAITIEIAREVLAESDFDANLVTLVANGIDDRSTTTALLSHKDVGIIDYTGGNAFGEWIEDNCKQAVLFTEKAGVNSIIMDSTADLKKATGNIAFSVSLYSGQMCTAPQNIFIPADGISVGDDHMSFDDASKAIVGAIDWLVSDAGRAVEVLGAIQNSSTVERIEAASNGGGTVLRPSSQVSHEKFPNARIRTPLVMQVEADQRALYGHECFGPVVFIVKTASTDQSIEIAADLANQQGAITGSVYSMKDEVLHRAAEALTNAGVAVSCNLMGQIFVNQAAAFSDYHVSGANPAGNATLCDAAFVANRFRFVQTRMPVT